MTVTLLMLGPTEPAFFERAEMEGTELRQSSHNDPADLATTAFDALMRDDADAVHGLRNAVSTVMADVVPSGESLRMAAHQAKPDSRN